MIELHVVFIVIIVIIDVIVIACERNTVTIGLRISIVWSSCLVNGVIVVAINIEHQVLLVAYDLARLLNNASLLIPL